MVRKITFYVNIFYNKTYVEFVQTRVKIIYLFISCGLAKKPCSEKGSLHC